MGLQEVVELLEALVQQELMVQEELAVLLVQQVQVV
jgi:ferritin-like metal-binding protein YciE